MMTKEKSTKRNWTDDDAPELTADVAARAQISVGGKIVRPATGTLTRRGRPPIGDEAKQQVTLRLPREVISHFKAGGPGWQTRISKTLEKIARKSRKSNKAA